MTKEIKNPYVKFIGSNSDEVTGSCNLVRFLDYTLLVDYGLRQTSNEEDDFKVNSKRHKDIKPKQLDGIIVTHVHADHVGLIPALYQNGCTCPTYIPKGSKGLITLMLQDTCKIFNADLERFGRKPIYTQDDVDAMLYHTIECDMHDEISINDNMSFIYYNAQHITKSCQVYLKLNDGIKTKTVGFTGDISNRQTYYLEAFEPLPMVDTLIGECTYSDNKRLHKAKDRAKDVEKIKMVVQSALQNKGKVLIPTFSSNRLQEILTTIYEAYGGKAPIKIIVNTPLGKNISSIWDKLIDRNHELWQQVYKWDNIRWVNDYKEMIAYSRLDEPMLIIGSGGFLNGGTAVFWTKILLNNKKNHLVFCGYSSEESVAGKIKSGVLKEIKIDGVRVHNKAKVVILNSFSSHMDYEQLLEYYSTNPYNKICLVHSEFSNKLAFAEVLKQRLSKQNRSSKVICTNYETKVTI